MKVDKELSRAAAAFAKRKHLVSISSVSDDDEITPLKGFMFLPGHQDMAMSAGHVDGLDVTLLVRMVPLPHSSSEVQRLIIEALVARPRQHIIALSTEHTEDDIRHLMAAYHHYARADVTGWRLFTTVEQLHQGQLVQPFLSQLRHHGVSDVEFEGNYLRLYIENMAHEGHIDELLEIISELNKSEVL